MSRESPPTTLTTPVSPQAGEQRPCLKVVLGAHPGRSLPLKAGKLFVGRADDCDLVVADESVSRRHIRLEVSEDLAVRLHDLGSHNGTKVDGQRIDSVVLEIGSTIELGQTVLRLAMCAAKRVGDRAGLSKRELEVAQLVGQGLTNEEVGARLHISRKTVTAHLSNVYDRLGFRTRAGLTRYLAEHGLLDDG